MNSGPPDDDYDRALTGWLSPPQTPAVDDDDPFTKKGPGDPVALERVRVWTRERFKLAPEAAILVSELECRLPGCPPLETVVAFWENDKRHHFKLFKPVEEVINDDLPYAWLKDALAVEEGAGWDCC